MGLTGRDRRYLGRRGTALLALGLIEIAVGLSLFSTPKMPTAYALFHEAFPTPLRAGMWIGCGVVGILFSRQRTPAGRDRAGFAALMLMPFERAVSFATSFVIWLLPFGNHGWSRGWAPAFIWAGFCTLLYIVAGWPEPPRIHASPERQKDQGPP